MKDFCKENGIDIQYTPRYTPELNGVAERMNRTIVEKAVILNISRRLYKGFFLLNKSRLFLRISKH
jgi:transposase InsO family protein